LAAGGTQLEQAHRLQDLVTARIAYRAGSTDGATTAAVALASGVGVCQDHAHVLIAAARGLGWPARYVAGYYLPEEDGVADAATHAWAEFWLDGIGWVGFDASNDLCPTDAYVRLCAGLDAFDAAPIRGHVQGASEEALDVSVRIGPGAAEQ
jgi:transglutaminase-like putative cysteine protease